MKNIYVFSIIVCLILEGCSWNKEVRFSGMVEIGIIENGDLLLLNDTSLWRYPQQMEVVDSFLIVLDEYDGYFFRVYSTDGTFLMNFGRKGQGPGELLWLNNFHLSMDRKKMYAYDDKSKKIIEYGLDSLFAKKITFNDYSVDRNKIPKSKCPTIFYDMLPLNDGKFLIKGNHTDLRYGIFDVFSKEIEPIYNSFLNDSLSIDSPEEVWSLFSSMTVTKLSPDKTKMVNSTYIGGMMEIFSLDSAKKKMSLKACSFIYEPIYGCAEGAVPVYVVNNQNTQFGFEDVCVTDKLIYALLHDEGNQQEPTFITVFDWDGNILKRIDTEKRIAKICLNENEKTMYLLVLNEENGYELNVMNLIPENQI